MALPRVVAVASGSPADRAGVLPGDELVALDGQLPRDIIEYHLLTDQETLALEVSRGGVELSLEVEREGGEPLGMEVDAALFDQVRTCDNHCEFCFIHQLPKGMRKSLYVRDDDYRLSFLYGNFTTLTRFTEADLERVLTEGLSPLFVSIHATDPEVRARMLRNRRGATSLRWLRALLDGGVEVHGQVVVCPGVNDAEILEATMAGVLDEYPELASVAFVPLGVSRFNHEETMRPHSGAEAATAVEHVASIAAIPGVDALFVGPSDLSASLGVPGQLDAPIFLDALDAVIRAAKAANVAAGILTGDPEGVEALNERGFSFVAVASDSALLRRAALHATSRSHS